jgi:type III secretory pathway component EscS
MLHFIIDFILAFSFPCLFILLCVFACLFMENTATGQKIYNYLINKIKNQ